MGDGWLRNTSAPDQRRRGVSLCPKGTESAMTLLLVSRIDLSFVAVLEDLKKYFKSDPPPPSLFSMVRLRSSVLIVLAHILSALLSTRSTPTGSPNSQSQAVPTSCKPACQKKHQTLEFRLPSFGSFAPRKTCSFSAPRETSSTDANRPFSRSFALPQSRLSGISLPKYLPPAFQSSPQNGQKKRLSPISIHHHHQSPPKCLSPHPSPTRPSHPPRSTPTPTPAPSLPPPLCFTSKRRSHRAPPVAAAAAAAVGMPECRRRQRRRRSKR